MNQQLFITYIQDSKPHRKDFDTEDQMDTFCRDLLKDSDFEKIEVTGFYGPGKIGMWVFKSPLPKKETHDH